MTNRRKFSGIVVASLILGSGLTGMPHRPYAADSPPSSVPTFILPATPTAIPTFTAPTETPTPFRSPNPPISNLSPAPVGAKDAKKDFDAITQPEADTTATGAPATPAEAKRVAKKGRRTKTAGIDLTLGPIPQPSVDPLALEGTAAPVELPDLSLDKTGGIDLTLEQSVTIAIRSATSVLKQQNNVNFTGAQLLQAYGQFVTNLTGSGNYTYGTGNQYFTTGAPALVHGSGYGAGYTLSADLNLFNGLADYANLKSSRLKKDSSLLTLYRAKQQIALDIAQAFLQVVLDNKLVDIDRKNLQESEAREQLLLEQTRVGVRNLADLFRQQAQTSTDESTLLTAENKTRQDQIAFLIRLRGDISKKYHFEEPSLDIGQTQDRFKDESTLLKTAISNRADLKASDNTANALNWDVRTQFAGYLPKLDLVGSIASGAHYLDNQTVNGTDVVPAVQSNLGYQLGNQIYYQIGLNLTWNIFDRFLSNENVQRARATADNSELDAQDTRNEVQGDVRQAYGNYVTAIQQLRTSKKGLDAAQKAYEVVEGRYEVGSASFVDLITAQAQLVQSESARAQALIDFQLQSRAIELAIGETQVE